MDNIIKFPNIYKYLEIKYPKIDVSSYRRFSFDEKYKCICDNEIIFLKNEVVIIVNESKKTRSRGRGFVIRIDYNNIKTIKENLDISKYNNLDDN